jgi:hypothetical protein
MGNVGVPGNNNDRRTRTTLQLCIELCMTERNIYTQSLEYFVNSKICDCNWSSLSTTPGNNITNSTGVSGVDVYYEFVSKYPLL